MKLSEKYLQSKRNGHGGLCLGEYESQVFGDIKYFEGKLSEAKFQSRKRFYEKHLEKIARENNIE